MAKSPIQRSFALALAVVVGLVLLGMLFVRNARQNEVVSSEPLSFVPADPDRQVPTAPGGVDFGDATRIVHGGTPPGPALVDLLVEGDDLVVFPDFDPDILRYAVRPGDATTSITINPIPSPGDVISFNGLRRPQGLTMQLDRLDPDEITVKNFTVRTENTEAGSAVREYEVVIVPSDYPVQIDLLGSAFDPGLALYATPRVQGASTAWAIKTDLNGVPFYWYRRSPDGSVGDARGRGGSISDFKPHPNGMYSYASASHTNEFDRRVHEIVILDERFREVDRRTTIGDGMNHTAFHDFKILENGNYLFLAYNGIERSGVLHEDSIVLVIDPTTDEEVLRWNSWDYVDLEADGLADRLPDYVHINSAFEDDDGDLYLSLRWPSSVVKIDGKTGETLWTFGGARNDFEIDDPWGAPCGQHTAQISSQGTLIIFDNGTPCPDLPLYDGRSEPERMRYVEYEIDADSMTATVVREIIHPTYAAGPTGSVQELDDGHVLVSWGLPGGDFSEYSIEEFDADDTLVRRFELAHDDEVLVSYRAYLRPEPNYAVLAEQGGASHVLDTPLRLGEEVLPEPDGTPATTAIGSADDDGVVFLDPLIRDEEVSVEIVATGDGYVNAWIDFNGDGDWDDDGENVIVESAVQAGTTTYGFVVPRTAKSGVTYARVRLSTAEGLRPTGPAPDGEVEDYQVQITNPIN